MSLKFNRDTEKVERVKSRMYKVIEQWANEELPSGVVLMIPKEKFDLLETKIADLLSNNCPEGGRYSNVFDEE